MKGLEVDKNALERNVASPRELANELFRITQHAYEGIPFQTLEKCEKPLYETVSKILKENLAGVDDDDQLMEDAEASTSGVETLSQKASKAVWGVIEHLFPADATCAELDVKDKDLLNLDKADLAFLLIEKVPDAYPDANFERLVRGKVDAMTSEVLEVIDAHKKMNQPGEKATQATQALAVAFGGDYFGTADDKFEKHLKRCCTSYCANSAAYTAPYVTITQSSGFGKSRILYRLAQKLERQPNGKMRLLYICGRDIPGSTGFPVATPELFKFIFPVEATKSTIAEQLVRVFEYACAHWGTVQGEWNGVFSAKATRVSRQLASKLEGHDAKQTAPPDNAVLVVVIDEARSLFSKTDEHRVDYFRLLRRALTQANIALWGSETEEELKTKPVIFAVLVDTNSHIYDLVPPLYMDPSSRRGELSQTRLFPPFVLTHTMDVFLKFRATAQLEPAPINYKQFVLETDSDKIRNVLLAMGRPLWYTQFTRVAEKERLHNVLLLGGTKLLCGLQPVDEESYRQKETLHGVAAVLCRLGLRPQSSSAFASQVVANFMAVLHAINYTHDAHIIGYVSEPFLTFAATHMWYEHFPTSMTTHMLPELRERLTQGVLDVGAIGEVVARIILLLAIDAAIMKSVKGDAAGFSLKSGGHRFQGQFCAVPLLLAQLDGTAGKEKAEQKPELRRVTIERTVIATKKRKVSDKTSQSRDPSTQEESEPKTKNKTKFEDPSDEQATHFRAWMKSWDEWSVGFSHFVELAQVPTKETLWCMLGRRAAGVFPRGQTGADLIIPVFRRDPGADVSYMLVQVKNVDGQDNAFPHSALSHMEPSRVFASKGEPSDLLDFWSTDIIRVFMALRQSNAHGAQSYFIDNTGKGDDGAYTLCLRGMCKKPKVETQSEPHEYWPFLGGGIWQALEELAEVAWWDPMTVVKKGLTDRKKHAREIAKDLPDEDVEEAAKQTLEIMVYDAGQAVPDEEMKAEPDAAALQQSGDP